MILVDTSVWVDHLHAAEPELLRLLRSGFVWQHPMVVGELAMGSLRDRGSFLDLLSNLPAVTLAHHDEVMGLIERRKLYGRGLSLVDAHLLAAVTLSPGTTLWTRDRRLHDFAKQQQVAFSEA
ncbi:type II toxin-antitoxin system VapC family toxin [Subtercola endophyticus]|uniref:type II toxin-antitoxin system VapC family toxin n=1 Tax=Subtercola endophyticus TaxID=2895559 RepID=UPI001E539450|nr:type II toxin-antitoxin system VapC family toxin [Subtercola endophyticus]UFS59885.1 type II toxin-antitoxin system VapC family toxin [Subtercola endophyticus]